MKKITTFLGCVGVVCFFWGCSSDSDLLSPGATLADEPAITPANDTPANLSSAAQAPISSSSSTTLPPDEKNPNPGTPEVRHDTVTKTVIIQKDPNLGETPTPNYRQDEVFCWSDECRAKYAGMTSNPDLQSSSSALSIDIGMSEEAKVPPTISGNTMTDMRDNQSYKLETVANTRWMAENLRYRTENGSFCEDKEGNDVCAKNKSVYYTYGVAQRVCPMGWRLPTADEVTAAAAAQPDSWWVIGGRFKLDEEGKVSEFGLNDGQGYIWIIQNGSNTSWRIKAYSGEDVEKAFQSSEGPRAYNVRCVEGADIE